MNEEMKKYYDILGVSDEATDQEVYKAYRGKDVIISQEVVNNWRSQKRVGITKRSYTYLHLENEEGEAYCHGCGKVDSLPSKRYLNLKYLPPCGVTRRKRPLPSNNFFFLFDGLDVRIFMSLSAIKDFLHFWGYLF